MDLQRAAANTLTLWQKAVEQNGDDWMFVPQRSETGTGYQHVQYVLNEVAQGNINGEKGHRWLGWAQGWLCCDSQLTLDDVKYANVLS